MAKSGNKRTNSDEPRGTGNGKKQKGKKNAQPPVPETGKEPRN